MRDADVVIVAKAVVEAEFDFFGMDDDSLVHFCIFCEAQNEDPTKIVHELDCPVSVARDLLTGITE